MNHLTGIFLVCVLFSLHCIFAKTLPIKDNGTFEIRDGNCTNASMADLVFHDHVHKSRIPFVSRDATSSWKGDRTIYCLLAISSKEESKGSTVKVTSGGVNKSFVNLEMHSAKSHGLEYDIQAFGKAR